MQRRQSSTSKLKKNPLRRKHLVGLLGKGHPHVKQTCYRQCHLWKRLLGRPAVQKRARVMRECSKLDYRFLQNHGSKSLEEDVNAVVDVEESRGNDAHAQFVESE